MKKRNFLYRILKCNPMTNVKTKHDECVKETTSWSECVSELKRMNDGLNRGLVYVKFELLSNF